MVHALRSSNPESCPDQSLPTDSSDESRFKSRQHGRGPDAWTKAARPGDAVVIDANGVFETGLISSDNSLGYVEKGLVGVVTKAGARDTDEIVKVRRPPVYCKNGYSTRGVRPGRLITESFNFPINGDGVTVVPRQRALEVGRPARDMNIGDEKGVPVPKV